MKTEQITVKACEVKAGDRIIGEIVTDVSHEAGCLTMISLSGLRNPARVPNEWSITVTRPLPDPCPRGRMTCDRNGFRMVDKRLMTTSEWELVNRRFVALWNEAEFAPVYRTTAEIEAGLEADKCGI